MEANAATRYKRTREDAGVVQSSCHEKETRSDLEHGKTAVLFRATSRRRRHKPKTHKAWLLKRGWPDSIFFASFHGFYDMMAIDGWLFGRDIGSHIISGDGWRGHERLFDCMGNMTIAG